MFYVSPIVIRCRDRGNNANILRALAVAEDGNGVALNGDDAGSRMGDHDQFDDESETTESKMDGDGDAMKPIRIGLVRRDGFYKSRKKEVGDEAVGVGAEQMDRADAVRLFEGPPSLAKIQESFSMIHKQHHTKLMEGILEEFEDDADSDSDDEDGDGDDDGDRIESEDMMNIKVCCRHGGNGEV